MQHKSTINSSIPKGMGARKSLMQGTFRLLGSQPERSAEYPCKSCQ